MRYPSKYKVMNNVGKVNAKECKWSENDKRDVDQVNSYEQEHRLILRTIPITS